MSTRTIQKGKNFSKKSLKPLITRTSSPSRGREDRTPINGFGDRRTTIVLFPYFPASNYNPLTLDIISQTTPHWQEKILSSKPHYVTIHSCLLSAQHSVYGILHRSDADNLNTAVLSAVLRTAKGHDAGLKPQFLRLRHTLSGHVHRPHLAA